MKIIDPPKFELDRTSRILIKFVFGNVSMIAGAISTYTAFRDLGLEHYDSVYLGLGIGLISSVVVLLAISKIRSKRKR